MKTINWSIASQHPVHEPAPHDRMGHLFKRYIYLIIFQILKNLNFVGYRNGESTTGTSI